MLKKRGVLVIVGLTIVFAILHVGFAPENHDPRTVGTTMLGGVAFLLMTSSLVLSTRADFLEDWFGGLDRVYQVHKIAGVAATLFVLVHFFGVPKELPAGIDGSANPLVPSAPLGMLALIVLVLSLLIALNRKISYSRWRPFHKLVGLVYVLAVAHFLTAPPIFFNKFGASGLFLTGLAAIGVMSFLYSVFGLNRRKSHSYEIQSVEALERATEVTLRPTDRKMDFKPGQFAFVEIQGKGWSEPHPFTISSGSDEDCLRFTIKVLGDWTRKVREDLQPGGKVIVRGPYGRFDTGAAGKKQIWLAGGVGLTPFLSNMRSMKPGDDRQIHLVYAARNKADALFLDELKTRAAELGNVTLVPLFSDEGNFARVDIMKSRLPDPMETYDYFMCGPKPMVNALMADLKKQGVERSRIHTEAFEFR